jgi:hypothetical protein
MHIPSKVITSAINSYKTNLKRLYEIEQRGKLTKTYYEEYKVYYDELYKETLAQERRLGFFGDESVQRWRNEAWLEYTENL